MIQTQSTAGFYGVKTSWHTVIDVQKGEEETRRAALERLADRYRQPIFHYIQAGLPDHRRQEAEDVTQEFIYKRLLAERFFEKVTPERGRFRTFVRECVANFLCEKYKEWKAKKRGGGRVPVSLDDTDGEGNLIVEPAMPALPPDSAMDRQWALDVLNNAMEALEQECIDARRGELFRSLKNHLGRAPQTGTAAEIGARLGISEGAVNVAMNRLRQRLGELISEEVRQTVGTEEDWREELKYLIGLLGQG